MNALVLSGGGSKAVYEWEVCLALWRAGMRWDLIAGVSAGALVGAAVAMLQWNPSFYEPYLVGEFGRIRRGDIASGGLGVRRGIQIALGKKYGFYDTDPLERLLERIVAPEAWDRPADVIPELLVGITLLNQRTYVALPMTKLIAKERIPVLRASASMPIIFEPVQEGIPGISWAVDGGIRNMSPLGDVLTFRPDHITIVNASDPFMNPEDVDDPESIVDVASETIYHLVNEVFRGDYKVFLDRNNEARRYELATGEPHPEWHVFEHTLIQPASLEWPKTLDFSPDAKRVMIGEAVRCVEAALAEGSLPI